MVSHVQRLTLCLCAAAVLLVVASPGTSLAEPAHERAQTCGLLPGDGAFNYVKVWNVGCAKANKVARKAFKRFCDPVEKCFGGNPNADPVKGACARPRLALQAEVRVGIQSHEVRGAAQALRATRAAPSSRGGGSVEHPR